MFKGRSHRSCSLCPPPRAHKKTPRRVHRLPRSPKRPQAPIPETCRRCALMLFFPGLHPVLDGGTGGKHPMIAPQVPTGGTGGQAVCNDDMHGQVHHATGVRRAGWGEIGQIALTMLMAGGTILSAPFTRRCMGHRGEFSSDSNDWMAGLPATQ